MRDIGGNLLDPVWGGACSRETEFMTRLSISVPLLVAGLALLEGSAVSAQQGGAGLSAGRSQAGSATTLSGVEGYGLNSRFGGSNFDMYTRGSSELGQTTAGARAGTAGFGQDGTRTTRGATTNFGRMGAYGGFGFGGFGGMFGYGRNAIGQTQQSAQGNKVIRTRTKLGFTQPTPPAPAVIASYSKVIQRVLKRDDYGSGTVNMSLEGEVAVLTGTVESSHVRDVAERLALLEPGISEVRNELTVRVAEPMPAK